MARSLRRRAAPGRPPRRAPRPGGSPPAAPEEASGSESLILATLRINILPQDNWVSAFTRAHPTVRLSLLNRIEVGPEVSAADTWISGTSAGMWTPELAANRDVERVEPLADVAGGCVYRVRFRNPPVIDVFRRLGLPIQFPLRVLGGYIDWEVVARRREFDRVLEFARRQSGGDVTIVSLRRHPLRSHLPQLSEAQQELLAEAMAAGYFAVPRRITLTELSRRLGRSKATVSETLTQVERKLLETVLRTPPSGA